MGDKPIGTLAVPVTSLGLSASAAASFSVGNSIGFLSPADEAFFNLTLLLGWVMLIWAVIVGGGYAILLVWRRLTRRQPVFFSEALLGAVSLGLGITVMTLYPLAGNGSGFGG